MFLKKVFDRLKLISLALLASCIPVAVEAQITPDGITSTEVTTEENETTIEQGDRVGDNLFHSFEQFSVPTGGSAGFNNAADIANIFSRVTGGDISNIDGLLNANGAANLFLVNPNGIIFGENASLDIGGSFFATSADSLLFEGDAEFSASNPEAAPLLEVNIPVGLNFRDDPGDVAVNGSLLEVANGENLSLIGGNVEIAGSENGGVLAGEGKVELGGLTEAGTIEIVPPENAAGLENSSLSFPEAVVRGNVSLSNFALVGVAGNNGGEITINARNVSLASGEFGSSQLSAGIIESGSEDAQAGDVVLNATDTVTVSQGSTIFNQVLEGAVGNGGNIEINAATFEIFDGSTIGTSILGQGDGGNIIINAANDTFISNASSLLSGSLATATGNTGRIEINTQNLDSIGLSELSATVGGRGNSQGITVNATGEVNLGGGSVISTEVLESGVGDSGDINLDAEVLAITGGSQLQTNTAGQGDAGNVNVTISTTGSMFLEDINLGELENPDILPENRPSGIDSNVAFTGVGNGGNITIDTPSLQIRDGAFVNSTTRGIGDAGQIKIDATAINLDFGRILSEVDGGIGNAAPIEINSDALTIDNFNGREIEEAIEEVEVAEPSLIELGDLRSRISTQTNGEGNGGNITLNVNNITLDRDSAITSAVGNFGIGDGGNIRIETNNLDIQRGSQVQAANFGQGIGGDVVVNAAESVFVSGLPTDNRRTGIDNVVGADNMEDGGDISINAPQVFVRSADFTTNTFGAGNAGNIKIDTSSLQLANRGQLVADTRSLEAGNAGNISIINADTISLDDRSSILSSVQSTGMGNGGEIQIDTNTLSLTRSSQVNSETLGQGNGGNITINAEDAITIAGVEEIDESPIGSRITSEVRFNSATGNAGNIRIDTSNLEISDRGFISSATSGIGDGAGIAIDASDSLDLNNGSIVSTAAQMSQGNAGAIALETASLNIDNNSQVNVSNLGRGNGGNISAVADDVALNNGEISAANTPVEEIAEGVELTGGEIDLQIADILTLDNNSLISAEASTNTTGGNVNLNSDIVIAFPGNNDIVANAEAGQGGNINLNTEALFGIEERSLSPFTNDINASSEFGLQGNIAINTPNVDPTSGLIELPASVADASDQVSQNPCQQGVESEFVVTGKGGLPSNPTDSLNSGGVEVGLVEPLEGTERRVDEVTEKGDRNIATKTLPAMGWVFNDKGEVTLIAHSNADTKIKRFSTAKTTCNSRINP